MAESDVGLTINDIALAVQVIQAAATRGTFKAEELSSVGGLFDRMSKFLEMSTAAVENATSADAASEDAPVADASAAPVAPVVEAAPVVDASAAPVAPVVEAAPVADASAAPVAPDAVATPAPQQV